MISKSELSAWSLQVSSYRQNHTVILFLIWICYQTVIHLYSRVLHQEMEWGKLY